MTMVPGNDWLVYHYARLSTASPPPGTWPQTTGDATAAGFGIFNADRHLHSGSIPGYSLQTWPASSMLLAQQILAPGQTWYGAIAVYFETASYAANNAVNQLGIPMLRVTLTGVGIA